MNRTVVIHGPQACGKTRNSTALARAFGCPVVVDDWDGRARLPDGVLALTNADRLSLPDRARVMDFDEAMREAGLLNRTSP